MRSSRPCKLRPTCSSIPYLARPFWQAQLTAGRDRRLHHLKQCRPCVGARSAARQAQIKLKQGLAAPLGQLQATARMIAEVQAECKLPVVPDEYVESFKPDLMDVIYAWSKVLRVVSSQQASCEGVLCGWSCQ